MSNPTTTEPEILTSNEPEPTESFADLLKDFESHSRKTEDKQIRGTVVSITADSVYVDIGYKTEGVLPLSVFQSANEEIKVGDNITVTSKGRNAEGYYDLSRIKVAQPKDWTAFEAAFNDKSVILGTVTGVVKGGLTVDVGLRAFLPASRTGTRDAAEMEKLVGQEIRCRITKLDVADEDLVVDRRSVLEEEAAAIREQRHSQLNAGDVLNGTVRSLTPYGAFIDLNGVDGLLHVGEISWHRISKPEDVLNVGDQIDVKVVSIDPATRRIALSMKALLPHPWDSVPGKYKIGDRVTGTITRLTDFGAFLELEPGVEGMIHVSEMSWIKKVRKPADIVKVGDQVETLILRIDPTEHRIALGLKQTLGDPWAIAADKLIPGSTISGTVMSFTKFGAFIQVAEGVEGMVHISEIVLDKRLNHPQDALRVGETVQTKVLEIDRERRQLKLSIKQAIPTDLDHFLEDHKVGDTVTGRIIDTRGQTARVELGEGVLATCPVTIEPATEEAAPATNKPLDLSALGSALKDRWKGSTQAATPKPQTLGAGQIRTFTITNIDTEARTIELKMS